MAASSRQASYGTSTNDEQWGGGPDQADTMSREQRKRWDPYHKHSRRGWNQSAPGNVSRGPRATRGAANFEPWQQDGIEHSHQQPQSNARPQLSKSPPVPPDQLIPRVGPLPPDHPLKLEMEELKQTRKERQYHWARLIADLGEDEWENPANYDRQRWEEEDKLADQKFEDLTGQIKLAEMGITGDSTQSVTPRVPSAYRTIHDQPSHEKMHESSAIRRGVEGKRHAPLSQRPERQNYKIQKFQHIRRPPKYPPGSTDWTEDRKTEAVQKWMDEMGMATRDTREESEKLFAVGDYPDNEDEISEGGYSRSNDTYKKAMSDTPLVFPDQDDLAKSNVDDRTVRDSMAASKIAESGTEALWITEENAIFEEAEAAREAHRMQLARMMTRKTETQELLDPVQVAREDEAVHTSATAERAFNKTDTPDVEPVTMDIVETKLQEQERNPRPVVANPAEQTASAGEDGGMMDALLLQLGTSPLDLRALALAATRDVEEPKQTKIMANEGDLLRASTTEDMRDVALAETQVLGEFEQSLAGTPKREEPAVSAVGDLRTLALAATQGVEESKEPDVAPNTGRQLEAFSLGGTRALALAATGEVEEVKQSRMEGSHVEQPAAFTLQGLQALALAATLGLEAPGRLETLANDEVQRVASAVESDLPVFGTEKDQVGAEVIAKRGKGKFQERPVAADFMDIEDIAVETIDMQDVSGSESSISSQILGDRNGKERADGHVELMAPPLRDDGPHTLYVGSLPKDITKEQLEELFDGFHM